STVGAIDARETVEAARLVAVGCIVGKIDRMRATGAANLHRHGSRNRPEQCRARLRATAKREVPQSPWSVPPGWGRHKLLQRKIDAGALTRPVPIEMLNGR